MSDDTPLYELSFTEAELISIAQSVPSKTATQKVLWALEDIPVRVMTRLLFRPEFDDVIAESGFTTREVAKQLVAMSAVPDEVIPSDVVMAVDMLIRGAHGRA